MIEKCRAKRKGNGEWRYGHPCFSDEGWFLIDEDAIAVTKRRFEDEQQNQ